MGRWRLEFDIHTTKLETGRRTARARTTLLSLRLTSDAATTLADRLKTTFALSRPAFVAV